MPSLAPNGEPQRSSAPVSRTADDLQSYLHERLQALELKISREQQRQHDQIEAALHTLREQLAALVQERQQRHQAVLTNIREVTEELRNEIGEALHRLAQDVDRVAQQAETQTNRAMERLRNELLHSLLSRDKTTVKRHVLGELLTALGKQLQDGVEDGEP